MSDLLPHEKIGEKLQKNTPEGQITGTKDVKFIIRKVESPKELSNDILHEVIGSVWNRIVPKSDKNSVPIYWMHLWHWIPAIK